MEANVKTSYDIIIIGSGVVGCSIARELSRFDISVLVIDKQNDIGGDASKSNSGIVHTGFDAPPNSLESRLVSSSSVMFKRTAHMLDIPFMERGALLIATTDEECKNLHDIKHKAHLNGVFDITYQTREQLLIREPMLNRDVKQGLLIPRESIVDPFLLVIALAENAHDNGVKFILNTEVKNIHTLEKKITGVVTSRGVFETSVVINAAGLFSDEIAHMVGIDSFTVTPRKGVFMVLKKDIEYKPHHILLPVPTVKSKGKLLTPTTNGNILAGPTAVDSEDKYDKAIDDESIAEILQGVQKFIPSVSKHDSIKHYCGLRPVRNPGGYTIELYDEPKGFLSISGIRSTGISSSLAVGPYVVDILDNANIPLRVKHNYIAERRGIPRLSCANEHERLRMCLDDSRYSNNICICERVSEGEIVEAITGPLGAVDIMGVKRRVRAGGMGRCQGRRCKEKVLQIIEREQSTRNIEDCRQEGGSL